MWAWHVLISDNNSPSSLRPRCLTQCRQFTGNKIPLYPTRPVPLLGGPHPPVRPPGPVLDSLPRNPPLRLLAGLEGPGHHAHQSGAGVHLPNQQGPLQVGRQPRGDWVGGQRRLGVCGRHKPEQGGGEARRRHGVSAGPRGVEGLPDGSAAVSGLWRRQDPVLIPR